eukprot:1299627-Amphidinium_carterae.1
MSRHGKLCSVLASLCAHAGWTVLREQDVAKGNRGQGENRLSHCCTKCHAATLPPSLLDEQLRSGTICPTPLAATQVHAMADSVYGASPIVVWILKLVTCHILILPELVMARS